MPTESITLAESARLVELEEVIEKGISTFIKVGEALAEIRDKKLYRVSHGTFEAYCLEEWQMSDRQARHLICGAHITAQLSENGTMVPKNERQARPLTKLTTAPEQQKAWAAAVESANGAQPTAAQVEAAVAEVQADAEPAKREPVFQPSNGMRYADLAIDSLKKIQPNDTQRDKAFMAVQRWLTQNYQAK